MMEAAELQQTQPTPKKKPERKLIWRILLLLPLTGWRYGRIGYRQIRYNVRFKWRLKEFIFINYWVLLLLLLAVVGMYFLLHKGPLYLAIPSLATELYITESTLRTVSIFVGIVFSFIVLSFNVFYKYFGRFAFIQFFTNRYIKFIFTLFIGAMIVLIYTCGYLKEASARDAYGDGLFILSLIVSAILVLAIIPTMTLLLRSSQNRDNIQELINRFNVDWSISYHINVLWKRGSPQLHYQRDPITLLTEIGTAAIKDFDRTSLLVIKDGCLAHLEKLHTSYQERKELHPDDFYDKLNDLTRNLYPVAIKERNETAALILLNLQFAIEKFYIEHFSDFNVYESSEHHYDGIRFMVLMKEYLIKALQFNEDGIAEAIITKLRDWMTLVVKTYFPAIKYDHPVTDRLSTDKSSFFISSTYYELERLFAQIFTYKKSFLYKEVALFYGVLNGEIVGSKNTRNTVVYLLQQNGASMIPLYQQFINLPDSEVGPGTYPFGHWTVQELLHIKSQVPLQYELRAFEYLFKQGKLNAYVINLLKAIAFHLMKEFANDTSYKKALLSIIRKFDHLRTFVTATSSDHQKEVYVLLERYLGHMQHVLSEYKVEDAEVKTAVADALGHFIQKDAFRAELEGKGYTINDVR